MSQFPSSHSKPVQFGAEDKEMQPLFLALGRATLSWAQIENHLAQWFAKLSNQHGNFWSARAIFFSVSGFANREAMMRAALRVHSLMQVEAGFLKAVLKKTHQWTDVRNAMAHGTPIRVDESGIMVPVITDGGKIPTTENLRRALNVVRLERAATNFNVLAWALFEATFIAHDEQGREKKLSELQMQVRLLPNDPTTEESDQTIEERRQQMQADDQKRAAQQKSKSPG